MKNHFLISKSRNTDPARREKEHNAGRGAQYTRSRRPVSLVYREECADKGAALRREAELKKFTHAEKEALAEAYRSGGRTAAMQREETDGSSEDARIL